MPEAPELTVVREVLERRLVGESIDSARIVRPTTLRDLVSDFETGVGGRSLDAVSRYGKVLHPDAFRRSVPGRHPDARWQTLAFGAPRTESGKTPP